MDLRSATIDELQTNLDKVAATIEKVATKAGASESRIDRLRRTVFQVLDQLQEVAERPDEPEYRFVTFTKTYPGEPDRSYVYVACRADNGYWYVSGSEKRYGWDALLDFIREGDNWAFSSLRYLEDAPPESQP